MKTTHIILAAGFLVASSASATITIDTVFVGDASNANDTTGLGGVSYGYHIGTHEVTNSQYTAFLNATAATDTHNLYNTNMSFNSYRGGISRSGSSGSYTYSTRANMANKPVNLVSFWDAARFANWLTNGQGAGNTEDGGYTLTSTGISNNTVTRNDYNTTSGNTSNETRWFVVSENEWYKAAYYDGSGSYFDYPTQSNTAPTVATANGTGDISNPGTNVANYNFGADWNSRNGNMTTVGSAGAGSASHYGTFDQGGNAFEWNDAIFGISGRGLRGGSFANTDGALQSSNRLILNPTVEESTIGFRVSSLAPIPEPSTFGLLLGSLALLLAQRRRLKN